MATSLTDSTRILCVVCTKAKGIYKCEGCLQHFCPKHSIEHRAKLNENFEEVSATHDSIQQKLNEQVRDAQQHPLIETINRWEAESISKIRQLAEVLRNELREDTIQYATELKQKLIILTNELKESRETDDFSEIDLQKWTEKLEELKQELVNPTIITIGEDITPLVTSIRIERRNTSDVFDRVCGAAEIGENGFLAVKANQRAHTEIRGRDEYEIGTYTMRFQIEELVQDGWIFFGIISKSETMRISSYNSSSSYGWSSANQTYVGGVSTSEVTSKIVQGDIIQLLISCNQQKIQLKNERTNDTLELSVDIDKCPFPWQLHLNLYAPNTHVRILSTDG